MLICTERRYVYTWRKLSRLFWSSKYYSLCHFIIARWLESIINFLLDSKDVFIDKKNYKSFLCFLFLVSPYTGFFISIVIFLIFPCILIVGSISTCQLRSCLCACFLTIWYGVKLWPLRSAAFFFLCTFTVITITFPISWL